MLSKFVRFSGMGLQMGLTIYLASLIGGWLDRTYRLEGISFFKILTILAVFAATYSIIRQAIKMGQDDEV